jgi:predicted aldo/keto reductase-like oxidoreductase
VAVELGITAIASASIAQGRLASDLPARITRLLPELETDAARSIQFTRSTPGITAALVGMRQAAHVAENLQISRAAPLDPASHARIEDALLGEAGQM